MALVKAQFSVNSIVGHRLVACLRTAHALFTFRGLESF